jgi:hypothetical protein
MDLISDGGSNACAGLTPEDREALRKAAATLLDARGIIMRVTDAAGRAMGALGGSASNFIEEKFGLDLKAKVEGVTEEVLWRMQNTAIVGMDTTSEAEPWDWFHKLIVIASGASGGFVGAPGLLFDLPITTGTIMRSVADIARTYPGESLDSDDTKRGCIEVFAFGGPENDDDGADAGYWAARAGLSHVAIEQLIKFVAGRFGVALSEKAIAQAVPIAGLVAGAGLNYAFIDYYQQMARVHFTIRGVERRAADPTAVRACFSEQVRSIRYGRKPREP